MNGITITIDTTPAKTEAATRAALAAEGFGILTEIDIAADAAERLQRALDAVTTSSRS